MDDYRSITIYLKRKGYHYSPTAIHKYMNTELGLRISSNCVEKATGLVVAQRQTQNGMSWPNTGSGALAQIKALFLNGWQEQWLFSHHFPAFDSNISAA